MQRLHKTFTELKKEGRKALITFITAGDPDLAATCDLVDVLVAAGADIVELGVPFSDPLADGPTIQAASTRSLAQGTTLKKIVATVKEIRRRTEIPLVLMTYYNPLYRYGLEKFIADACAAGVDGLIVPDLPLEESAELRCLAAAKLAVIPLAAPTTPDSRLAEIVAAGRGFLYYVTVTGITGTRTTLPAELAASLDRVKKIAGELPLAAGFGIATPEQARVVGGHADAVIVGSALVEIIARHGATAAGRNELGERVRALRHALDG
ncbi:MAG: tryptophan synthase subunit alpha [Deltaproteobacteria bacterium]|nr:tryptophan synthase subunit alpha [Deltaproteobacteria bacterium]